VIIKNGIVFSRRFFVRLRQTKPSVFRIAFYDIFAHLIVFFDSYVCCQYISINKIEIFYKPLRTIDFINSTFAPSGIRMHESVLLCPFHA